MLRGRIRFVLKIFNLFYGELETVSTIPVRSAALQRSFESCEHKPHALWKFVKQLFRAAFHFFIEVYPNRNVAVRTARR
jgi:hypothetical protein